jgi:S1-C subfamily serine protease
MNALSPDNFSMGIPHVWQVAHSRGEVGSPGPRFVGLQPESVLARCGIRNGDHWISVNGVPLKPDTALQAYASFHSANRLVMKLLRDGHEVTLAIVLTE